MTKTLFKITFSNQDSVYELYARSLKESELFGFLQVEDLVFGEQTALVVDPSEERLKLEFSEVKRTYIPMHAVFRIDEINKQGAAKLKDNKSYGKISPFPGKPKRKE